MGDIDYFLYFIVNRIGADEVLKIFQNMKPKYYCPNCKNPVEPDNPCQKCGTPLRWL